MGKIKWSFGMDELVYRDVVRKYLDPKFEWLSKISSKEYHKWKTAILNLHSYSNLTEVQKDKKILEEIELKERQYQRHKKEWKENRKRNELLDIAINNNLNKIHDLVATPGNKDAIIRADKYEPVTASTRINKHDRKHIPIGYRKLYKAELQDEYERSHKDLDWMHGEGVKWDKCEKYMKKHLF